MSYNVNVHLKQCVLKNDELFVTIDSESENENELQLCTKDIPGGLSRAPKVWICTRPEGERIQVAFFYKYEHNWYIAKVKGEHLQLEKSADTVDTISESCWFQTENQGLGSSCCLRNVENNLYLCSLDHKLCARQSEKSLFTFS